LTRLSETEYSGIVSYK